jgi:hypothetical protein
MLVNADDLITALEASEGEVEWYLDLTNGAVVPLFTDLVDDDPDLADAVENQPDRFLLIDPIGSHGAFRIMEAFVEALPDGEPTARLAAALSQRHPFRQFKDALVRWPHIREQWFSFHHARMREIAQDWLTGNEVAAQLTDRPTSSPEA